MMREPKSRQGEAEREMLEDTDAGNGDVDTTRLEMDMHG
jgi:hypothetical protein